MDKNRVTNSGRKILNAGHPMVDDQVADFRNFAHIKRLPVLMRLIQGRG